MLVQLSDELVDERFVSDDGFHPNDAGHAAIAEQFLDAIDLELGLEQVAALSTADLDPLA